MPANQPNQGQPKTREEYKRFKAEQERIAEFARLEEKKKAKQAKLEAKLALKQRASQKKENVRQINLADKQVGSDSNQTKLNVKENGFDPKNESNPAKMEERETPKSVPNRLRARMIPIWLRLVILTCMIIVCVTAGAMVGYGSLGGGKVIDVFKESTWTHIRDLVDKK